MESQGTAGLPASESSSNAAQSVFEQAAQRREMLHQTILDEIREQDAISGFGLSHAELDSMAWGVATRVDFAFDVSWTPERLAQEQVHVFEEAGGWRAVCNVCLVEGELSATEELARMWHLEHWQHNHDSHDAANF